MCNTLNHSCRSRVYPAFHFFQGKDEHLRVCYWGKQQSLQHILLCFGSSPRAHLATDIVSISVFLPRILTVRIVCQAHSAGMQPWLQLLLASTAPSCALHRSTSEFYSQTRTSPYKHQLNAQWKQTSANLYSGLRTKGNRSVWRREKIYIYNSHYDKQYFLQAAWQRHILRRDLKNQFCRSVLKICDGRKHKGAGLKVNIEEEMDIDSKSGWSCWLRDETGQRKGKKLPKREKQESHNTWVLWSESNIRLD